MSKRDKIFFRVLLGIAIGLSMVLWITAIAKFYRPYPYLKKLEYAVASIELMCGIALCRYYRKPWVWGGMACILAAWGGYAAFWYTLDLPCPCMGEIFRIPSQWTVLFDFFVSFGSLFLMFLLIRRQMSIRSGLCVVAIIVGIAGVVVACGYRLGALFYTIYQK